jgi:hypothetical protein
MKLGLIRSKAIILALLILPFCLSGYLYAASDNIPIPQNTDVVIWLKSSQIASDPSLKSLLLENQAVNNYLSLLNLSLDQVDYIVLFSPFDKTWATGGGHQNKPSLPQNGAVILSGKFDSKNKYGGLKSKGWKVIDYSNKKLLWWSVGGGYYIDPKGNGCISLLPGGRLLMTGSEGVMREILDVSGGKKQGMTLTETYQNQSDSFFTNNSILISAYANVTSEMRQTILADTSYIRSSTARAAMEYINHIKELGISTSRAGHDYFLEGNLGMDSDNNALIVSSLLQIGGGLASLLPPDDPNRELLSSLAVSRVGNVVTLQARMTGNQLIGLIKSRR